MEATNKKRYRKSTMLIWLCWLVYMCSYLGKVNYSANITQIESYFNVTHAEAGLVSTCFFFAYGAGQIINGMLCSKYNAKYAVFFALISSALCNLGMAIVPSDGFWLLKYLWLVNGISLSVLWPSLIGLLSKTLKKEDMSRASVTMGTTVACGTLIIYGLSSIYATWNMFRLSFYTAAIIVPAIGVVWLCLFKRLTTADETDDSLDITPSVATSEKKIQTFPKTLLPTIAILAVFAVATNLVADGLMTWVPAILKETYDLPDSLSILLTLFLPVVSVFGNLFANILHKRIPDFIYQAALLFLLIGVCLCIVLGVLPISAIITLALFACVRFLAGSSNATITSVFPLLMKGKVNSGLLAGLLNGFCYVGSVIASYGLGVIADIFAWSGVFYVLIGACALVLCVALVYAIGKACKKNREKTREKQA